MLSIVLFLIKVGKHFLILMIFIFIFSISLFTGMPKFITNAKIACLDFSLQKVKMKLGVQVLINDPSELEAIRKRLV